MEAVTFSILLVAVLAVGAFAGHLAGKSARQELQDKLDVARDRLANTLTLVRCLQEAGAALPEPGPHADPLDRALWLARCLATAAQADVRNLQEALEPERGDRGSDQAGA